MSSLNKKLLVATGILSLLLISLLAVLRLTQRPQIIEKEAVETPASLSLSPSSGTFNKDGQFAINIFLNTGGKNVVGVDVSLSFDSEKLQVQEVQPGSLFESQIVFKNEVNGSKILLSLGSFSPYNGSGNYGTIQFLAKTLGTASVAFDPSPQTKVSEEETAANLLGQVANGTYEIIETAAEATPTPTQEATAPTSTPVPTATSIPTNTPIPTQTLTSTPSPTPKPTTEPGTGGLPDPTATPTPQPITSPTSTPNPTSPPEPEATSTPVPNSGENIGGSTEPTSTPTSVTQVGMGELTSPTATPTPIQLPSAGFTLPSIFAIFAGALLIISAFVFV